MLRVSHIIPVQVCVVVLLSAAGNTGIALL